MRIFIGFVLYAILCVLVLSMVVNFVDYLIVTFKKKGEDHA